MSRIIKRSGRALLWTAALLAVAALLGTLAMTTRAQQSTGERDDELLVRQEQYVRTQTLRRELRLENLDLAVVGLSPPQAEALLTTLHAWCGTNQPRLAEAELAVNRAGAALREATRKVRVGPRDESVIRSLPRLRDALTKAEEAQRSLYEEAAAQVSAKLLPAQRQGWVAARSADASLSPVLRQAGLTPADLPKLRQGLARMNQGKDDSFVANLMRDSRVQQAANRSEQNLAGVTLAEAAVMPNPWPSGPAVDPITGAGVR